MTDKCVTERKEPMKVVSFTNVGNGNGLAIPEGEQEFVILPDNAKVRFESTGPLMKYLDER